MNPLVMEPFLVGMCASCIMIIIDLLEPFKPEINRVVGGLLMVTSLVFIGYALGVRAGLEAAL